TCRRCSLVPEQRMAYIPYTTCRMIPEVKCEMVRCYRCRYVTEEHVQRVPYTTCRMVAEECVRMVPYCYCTMEPHCVTYKVCRRTRVCVPTSEPCCPPPCPPNACCFKPRFWLSRLAGRDLCCE